MSAKAVMIFAAGRGTRMRGLTADRPKPMVVVAGRPLIDHALDLAEDHGIAQAVVNAHYKPDLLEAHLAGRATPQVRLSHEAKLLETGGGLKHAQALLSEGDVWTANADAVWRGPNPFAVLGAAAPAGGARLLVVPRAQAVGHPGAGDFFLAADGQLTRRGSAESAPFVYTGVQVIDPGPVVAWPETAFSLNPVWDAMAARGRLTGVVYPGQWCDVGQPESIALAEAMVADG